jgi:hypothetical protein
MNFKSYTKLILEGTVDEAVVIYSGKFQPFHVNHYKTYQFLTSKYGTDNVYIATAGIPKKPVAGKHILDFDEKKKIITAAFPDIPSEKIVKESNVYNPQNILGSVTEDVPYIAVVGQKDADRLTRGGKYFNSLADAELDDLNGWKESGYVEVGPHQEVSFNGELVTGTLVREVLKGDDEDVKDELISVLYPNIDEATIKFIKGKFGGGDLEEEMGMPDKDTSEDTDESKPPVKPTNGKTSVKVTDDKGKETTMELDNTKAKTFTDMISKAGIT